MSVVAAGVPFDGRLVGGGEGGGGDSQKLLEGVLWKGRGYYHD